MTAKKKPERRSWDAETKRKAVAALEAREDGRTAEEIAAEFGTTVSSLYYWRNAAASAETAAQLELPETKPKRKASKANGANGHHQNGASAPLTPSEREELIAARIELARLRKVIAAAL